MKCYILDACAIIAYLKNEQGSGVIHQFFIDATNKKCELFFHASNLFEVYYQSIRDDGQKTAGELWDDIHLFPINILYTFDESFIKIASKIKAENKLSVIDSFLLAQAKILNAAVITSDHHEFDILETKRLFNFEWYR